MKKSGYAVITGASSGIGMIFAERLAQKGYPLVLVARRKERLKNLADRLKEQYGTKCRIIPCDVSALEECKRLMQEIEDISVDIFINNAGFGDCCPFMNGNLEKELGMVDVNVKAVHTLMKLMLKRMCDNNYGYI